MSRKILVLAFVVAVLVMVGGIATVQKAQAVTSCSPACGTGRFCCIRSNGTPVCVTDACPLACPEPCCLVDCHWTCCVPAA
jgi:hypothetical protein